MTLYIFILIILLVFWSISYQNNKQNIFLWIGISILIIIASLKSINVGTDSYNYYDYFQYVKYYKQDRIFTGIQRIWFYYNYYIHHLFNYTIFLFSCYSIAFFGVGYYIYKSSKDKMLSLIIFYLIFYIPSLNIMRQYIAIGIFSIALVFLNKNKIKEFILLIIIGTFFHYSLILTLPIVWLRKYRVKYFYNISLVILSFIVGFFLNILHPIVNMMSLVAGLNEGSTTYLDQWGEGERNIVTNVIINIVFIITYLINKNKNYFLINMWLFYVIFNNLFGAAGQGNRLFLYLLISMVIVIPNSIKSLKYRSNRIIFRLFYIGYAVCYWYILLISGNSEVVPYEFR